MNAFFAYGLLMERTMETVGRDSLPKATFVISTPQYKRGERQEDQPVAVVIYGDYAQDQYDKVEEGYSYAVQGWTKSRKWESNNNNRVSWITENVVGSIHRCE